MSDDHEAPITCKIKWTGPLDDGETVYIAIGVRFIKISTKDREMIEAMVAEYIVF